MFGRRHGDTVPFRGAVILGVFEMPFQSDAGCPSLLALVSETLQQAPG
jgi:hypothetical protein